MPDYSFVVNRAEFVDDEDIDGTVVRMIALDLSVMRDVDTEIGAIQQRYGEDIDNNVLRDDIRAKTREIVMVDYLGLQRAQELLRIQAITSALEDWSRSLP